MVMNELWENWVRDRVCCDHCGSVDDVRMVDLHPNIRRLCKECREAILKWV